jgi:hypothetical protein
MTVNKEAILDMLDKVDGDDMVDAEAAFKELMDNKLSDIFDVKRKEVAFNMFNVDSYNKDTETAE